MRERFDGIWLETNSAIQAKGLSADESPRAKAFQRESLGLTVFAGTLFTAKIFKSMESHDRDFQFESTVVARTIR